MKNIIEQAVTALLSGITSYKPGTKEILWENEDGDEITVEYIGGETEYAIVRRYYENGQKRWEREYHQGQPHGKSLVWCENGQKYWKKEYRQGQQYGKDLGWWENGKKRWEEEYHQGQQHGKSLYWWENGQKHWEIEYHHGELTSERYY